MLTAFSIFIFHTCGGLMLDAILIVAGVSFFLLAVLYSVACDHL